MHFVNYFLGTELFSEWTSSPERQLRAKKIIHKPPFHPHTTQPPFRPTTWGGRDCIISLHDGRDWKGTATREERWCVCVWVKRCPPWNGVEGRESSQCLTRCCYHPDASYQVVRVMRFQREPRVGSVWMVTTVRHWELWWVGLIFDISPVSFKIVFIYFGSVAIIWFTIHKTCTNNKMKTIFNRADVKDMHSIDLLILH